MIRTSQTAVFASYHTTVITDLMSGYSAKVSVNCQPCRAPLFSSDLQIQYTTLVLLSEHNSNTLRRSTKFHPGTCHPTYTPHLLNLDPIAKQKKILAKRKGHLISK